MTNFGQLHLLALCAEQVGHVKKLLRIIRSFVCGISLRNAVIVSLTEKHVLLDSVAQQRISTSIIHFPNRKHLTELHHV